MERIVAMVEGHTETHFVNATYANAIVQRPFPNGDDVEIDLIVESINDRLETVGGEIEKVLILLDREGRSISASEMATQILNGVSAKNSDRKIYVGVSDREFENWIIADETHVVAYCNIHNYTYPGDGCGGKKRLKQLTSGVDLGYRDKALLLKSSYASRIRQKSESFEGFVLQLDFPWWWAER